MKINIGQEDVVDVNLNLINSLVFEANCSIEKENKIKKLVMAKRAIENTLTMMGFSQDL